ncbi:unnamed protein product [Nippostrongylus brasiliensis]|uniref:G_PROTEIN_RECEP_F1_2 domain-containing protein n=1 Tax=Nippostrongylus brasiliensis TaxID=27835 RepID=A0A158QZF0_NIPBR|nr:unnamed protein product [Nippostrongylus brasiliensis]
MGGVVDWFPIFPGGNEMEMHVYASNILHRYYSYSRCEINVITTFAFLSSQLAMEQHLYAFGLFALVTSFDRFYCVMFPIRYIRRRIRYAFVIMFSPYIIAVAPILIAVMGSYPYRFIEDQPATCNLANALTAGNFLMLRCIRIVTTLSCVMIYIPIFIKMYKNIRVHYALSNLTARNQKKLLRMTLTIGLITSNTILLFTVPDIILICHPEYSSNFFYLLNLNKGVINVIIFLATQRTFRRVILGKPDITQQSFKVSPKTVVGFALTKLSSPNSA